MLRPSSVVPVPPSPQLYGVNVVVHQFGAPSFELRNHSATVRAIHLSYHDGEHYCSVRSEADDGRGVALPIGSATEVAAPGGETDAGSKDGVSDVERHVMRSTLCENVARVREMLEMCVCVWCQWERERGVTLLYTQV
jgi:hypothetical protein